MNEKRVYLAGSIEGLVWEDASKWRNKAVEMLKDAGIEDVYNPVDHIPLEMRNGIITAERVKEGGGFRGKEIVAQDLFRLRRCNIFLVNLDDPGSGTMAEMGIKWAQGGIIIGFSEWEGSVDHPFIVELADVIYDTLDEAVDFIINI